MLQEDPKQKACCCRNACHSKQKPEPQASGGVPGRKMFPQTAHSAVLPALIHRDARQGCDLRASRDENVFGRKRSGGSIRGGHLHLRRAAQLAPSLHILDLHVRTRARTSKVHARWAARRPAWIVRRREGRNAQTALAPAVAQLALFFLNSPSMPLVKPSTALVFCRCMAATSTATPSTSTPCFWNAFFASAYIWLDCSKACSRGLAPIV